MGLEDAEDEIEQQDYREAMDDIQEQIKNVESDFETVKTDNASGELAEKQKKAEEILSEIHDQVDFLREQVERMEDEGRKR
ncbi:MAG: hypothetical protein ABEK10_00710 [Candidatus Nanosalina sp.]